jgi:hypothetical protein
MSRQFYNYFSLDILYFFLYASKSGGAMKPETITYRLKLKGYSLSKIARELGVTRQTVWYVVNHRFEDEQTNPDRVRTRIKEILS